MPTEDETKLAHQLVATLASKMVDTLKPDGATPASVLEWLAAQPEDTIRHAIVSTQPQGWSASSSLLVDSLSVDQRIGMLAALIAVWVQAAR